MGKTAKRQNKRAAAMLGAKGGTSAKKKSHAPVSAAALGDAMGMQTDDAAGVNIDRPTATARDAKRSTTSVGRVARAVEADLTQEACVALDALLAEVERGERAETCSLDLCSKVLGMCQRAGKAKPALRLLTRMELCGLPVGPVQLRQVFFACCARGMTHEALALMARRGGSETSARALGKDVLVRGCGMVPGGADAPDALALLEGALRGALSGNAPWELAPPEALRFHPPALWRPPEGARGEVADGGPPSGNPHETLAEAAEAAAAALYPGGVTGEESFWLVSDDDGRRRPADRRALRLWAPSSARVIPLEPAGLEPDTDRVDVPGLPGAFVLTNFLTKTETAAFRAAAHAVGFLRDDTPGARTNADGGEVSTKLDYCEILLWPETADRLWRRVKSHAPAGAVGVNARLRLFRYGPNTVYRKHVDGSWPEAFLTNEGEYVVDASEGQKRSRLTLLAYLSDGFEGGATTFFGAVPGKPGEVSAVAVEPREGAALCFPHGDAEDSPVHEGSAVFPGANGARHKYVARTDVLFQLGKG